MKKEQIALQLYTLRDHLKSPADIAASMKKVREIGYEAVQLSGLGPIEEGELNRILDGEGLTCCATHEPTDEIIQSPEQVVERLKKLGCAYTAVPFPAGVDMSDEASVMRFIEKMDAAGKVLADNDCVLTYHNHSIEFRHLNGRVILEIIYEKTNPANLQGEIDTYWIQHGGGDPVAWCAALRNRLPLVHLKDYGISDDRQPVMAEIGNGNLNMPAIIREAEKSGCEWFIVEQDVCPADPFDSAKQSYEYLLTLCS